MAWTTPRTWVVGELVTAALLNTHLRDNLKHVEAKATAGSAHEESVTWTTAFPSAPVVTASVVGSHVGFAEVVSTSTTGAVVRSYGFDGTEQSWVKHVIATDAS